MIGFLRLLETGFLPTGATCGGEELETRFLCPSRDRQIEMFLNSLRFQP
ncbi:hypothetical protein PN466_07165 [Roseofilum reptotaenium CS-1145]|nr:hypothetical protein [Roseofilum reptotaenium]MDB9516723.1 hypothetical protein [Roseofilum reptotaenium CS-1145]